MSALNDLYNNDVDRSSTESDRGEDAVDEQQEEAAAYQDRNGPYEDEEEPESSDNYNQDYIQNQDSSESENYNQYSNNEIHRDDVDTDDVDGGSAGEEDFDESQATENDDDGAQYGQREQNGYPDDGYEDSQSYIEDPDQEQARSSENKGASSPLPPREGLSRSQSICLVFCCCILIILALVGGAILGAYLSDDEDSRFRDVVGLDSADVDRDECPTPAPTTDGTGNATDPGITRNATDDFETDITKDLTTPFTCDDDNVPLEFRLVHDASPGDIGLRVSDVFNTNIWKFERGSFGSFALLLRENFFTLCMSPFQNYTFEITDAGEDGLISEFGTEIFGSFRLSYAGQEVTSYNGNCLAEDVRECGQFCKCTYALAVDASSGECTTSCL